MAIYGDVPNAALQKLISGIAASIRQPNGSILSNFVDRTGKTIDPSVPSDKQATLGKATEFDIKVSINPDGNTAKAWVTAKTPMGVQTIEGQVDVAILATKLV